MQVITTILVMIVMLGILISTHELGHLLVAKAYNVYCLEYSIGMGPVIFKRKKKGGETTFSIRALPLGGFVSMYGEGVELPEGETVGRERSLQGIKWWKRCLVMLAGISVNLLTAIIFSFTYATCFPSYYTCSYFDTGINREAVVSTTKGEETARAFSFWCEGEAGTYVVEYGKSRLYAPDYAYNDEGNAFGYIVDCNTEINGEQFVAVFNLKSIVNGNDLVTLTEFYPVRTAYYQNSLQKALRLDAKPMTANGAYKPKAGDTIVMTPTFIETANKDNNPTRQEFANFKDNEQTINIAVDEKGKLVSDSTITVRCHQYWQPFGQRMLNGCSQFKSLFVAIGEGFRSIFTGHLENVGSVVAAGSMVSSISNEIGWIQTFFFYGGFLALNLALFNLLPFPGLDGYQLLVVLIETVFRKQIPEKVKGAISLVGLGLLLSFSVFIIFRDIVRLF